MRIGILMALALLVLAGCGVLRPGPDRQTNTAIVQAAIRFVGTPYRYGGASPRGFDCSGLVQYTHSIAGVAVPRTTAEQNEAAKPVSLRDLQPGDLLFFRMQSRRIDHVGIYVGDDRFIHAPSTGRSVSYASLDDPYFRKRLVRAGRLWST